MQCTIAPKCLVILTATALLLLANIDSVTCYKSKDMSSLDMAAERRAENIHRINSIILLTYITVMVVIVLTAWLFKHYRFRFVHESGLTLLYGLLIGLVFKYFDIGLIKSQTFDVEFVNKTGITEPPDYLRLEVQPGGEKQGENVSFHYELIEGFTGDKSHYSEQKLEQKASFSPEIFFNILLPPIIFNAGYSLKKRHFFRNIGSILAIVFVGTTISCFLTGCLMFIFTFVFRMGFTLQELFYFGAVISATDPVTVISIFSEMNVEADLFALVFGESALNDAVAIVLANTIDNISTGEERISLNEFGVALWKFVYVFFGSLMLGSAVGCGNALVTKMTAIADYAILESTLFILVSYLSFLVAEVVGFTGIVSVLFCGICQAHYTFNNLSDNSRHSTKEFFQIISFVLESFIFCYIGVSVFVSKNQLWNPMFLIFALISIVVARAGFVYPLSYILNIRRRPKIPMNWQHMMVFSGLRGAMAFALADRNTATTNRQTMCGTTAAIVIITVFVNGGFTSFLIDYLKIKHGKNVDQSATSQTNAVCDGDSMTLPNANDMDDVQVRAAALSNPTTPSGSNPWDKAFLPRKWYNFDANFMKPLLTHATPSLEQTLPSWCLPFANIFTSDRQRMCAFDCMGSSTALNHSPDDSLVGGQSTAAAAAGVRYVTTSVKSVDNPNFTIGDSI